MDTLAALALATEPPTDELLNRSPAPKRAHLINYRMAKLIVGEAIFQIGINLFLIHLGAAIFHLEHNAHGEAVLKTIVFNTFVFLQIFNEINCRFVVGYTCQFSVDQSFPKSYLTLIVNIGGSTIP